MSGKQFVPLDDGLEIPDQSGAAVGRVVGSKAAIHPALAELIQQAQAEKLAASEIRQQAQQEANQMQAQAVQWMMLAVKTLSQRFVVAVASLFTLLTVASAFVLWLLVPNPSVTQLVGMGMYCLFVLAINILVVWRK